ncbi:MAG TPA: C4-type zinc ribbon domain-containing protein [Terracidiphilus sp.]|nr:C4-type zinc ribbon domain-containing protein [Terracidiphilus sp.]
MQAHVENLVKLQRLELDRTRLAQLARALPAEAAQAEAALAAAQRRATEASDALSREETLRTRLERDISGHRQKAARYRVQQDSVTTPAQAEAIEHEVRFAESEISRLEDEELASMERTEAQEAALAQARAAVEELALALDKTRERIQQRQQELSREQAALQAEREVLRQAIEPKWLTSFDRIAASRNTGLARAENQQCTSCSMGVRPQTWNQLREGELLNCDSCGRLLYWDPAMAPAPKLPQTEKASSDGRAVRKPHQAEA